MSACARAKTRMDCHAPLGQAHLEVESGIARRWHRHAIAISRTAAKRKGAESCVASASAPMAAGPRIWPASVIVRNQPTATPCCAGATSVADEGRRQTRHDTPRHPDRDAPEAQGDGITHEGEAPEQCGIGEQPGHQHPHSSPLVGDTPPEPQRQQSAEHAQADEESDGFRAKPAALDQIERIQEDQHAGLDRDQHRVGHAHEQHPTRAQDRPEKPPVVRRQRRGGSRQGS